MNIIQGSNLSLLTSLWYCHVHLLFFWPHSSWFVFLWKYKIQYNANFALRACVVLFPSKNWKLTLSFEKMWRRPFSHEECVGNIFLIACLVLPNLCLQKKKSTKSCIFQREQNNYLVHLPGAGQLIYISNAWGWGAVFICWSHLFFSSATKM